MKKPDTRKIGSLMYREWTVMKKNQLFGLAVVLGLLVIWIVFALGFRYGNFRDVLAGDKSSEEFVKDVGLMLLPFLFVLPVYSILTEISYDMDIRSGWTRYAMTFPADCSERALAHTLLLALRVLAGFAAVFPIMAVIYAALGKDFTLDEAADIGILACVSLIFPIISEIFISRAKDAISLKKQKNTMMVCIMAAGVAVGLFCSKFVMPSEEQAEAEKIVKLSEFPVFVKYRAFRGAFMPFVIPVLILIFVMIFFIVRHNLEAQKKS